MNQTAAEDHSHSGAPSDGAVPAPLDGLRDAVLAAAAELAGKDTGASIMLERPCRAQFGDYSTNAALILAPGLASPPREVAERLGALLAGRLGPSLDRFEVAGPG